MRIEKYHAEDMQEAFRLIKADLGSEAVVIQTKKVRLGLLGWFKKPVYEVIAAVDEEVARPPKLSAAVADLKLGPETGCDLIAEAAEGGPIVLKGEVDVLGKIFARQPRHLLRQLRGVAPALA